MDSKFSDWLKIDLHIHTDLSRITKPNDYRGEFTVEVLHDKLTVNNVKIFSLTDHNIINISAYREYYERYSSDDDPLLLLGVELDIARIDKTYHSLLIFNYSSIEKVEIINNKLEEKYSEKSMDSINRNLTIEEIVSTFPDDDFFFIPHAGNTASIVAGYSGEIEEAQKMIILLQSPMEKVPEKRKHIYNENFDKVLYEAFRNKDDYAYIEFSDNHNINNYPCKHKGSSGDHIFYYIKGSKNYETLRLAFIDPKSRIKSTADLREINQRRNYIEKLDIISNSVITESVLEFSPHLNVIIGGRSSGKSLLMDLLNRSIDTLNNKSKYDSILLDSTINIKSKYDVTSKNKTSLDFSIIQVNQGDIVSYFENNNLEDLSRKSGNIDNYNHAKENLREKKIELEYLILDIQNQYKLCYELDMTKQLVIFDQTISNLLNDEFHFLAHIEQIEKMHIPLEELTRYQQFIVNMTDTLDKLKLIEFLNFTETEFQTINTFNSLLNEKNRIIEKNQLTRNKIDIFLSKVSSNIRLANSELSQEGQNKAESLEYLNNIIITSLNRFNALALLKKACKKIDEYSIDHKEIVDLTADINLCLEVSNIEKINDTIIEGINDSSDQSLYNCLLKLLYNETSVKNFRDNLPLSLIKKISTQLSSIFKQFDNPNDYLEYSDGSNSKSNSLGYNSEKYLQVVLNNELSKLILIDQPEDNLGNKFISKTLVELIRSIKFKKQIFLVTHNPAIVVYGDAESIILAKNNGNKIYYNQIKLENEVSQKEICEILDGGEYIFDNRARKYNIQKLLMRGE